MKNIIVAVLMLFASMAFAVDTYTPNLNLTKPGSGSINWAGKINGDFDIIDSSVPILSKYNVFAGSISATSFIGSGTDLTGVIFTTATGTYPLSISGTAASATSAPNYVLKAGDTITGKMTTTVASNILDWTYSGFTSTFFGSHNGAIAGDDGFGIYDHSNSWNGRLDLGLIYGPQLHGKGAVAAPLLGLNDSTPQYALDVTGGGHFTSSMTVDGGYYGNGATLTGVITSTAALQADINLRLLKAGGTMTGQLTLLASSITVNGMGLFTSTVTIGENSYPVEQCSAGYILTGDGTGLFQCQPQPAAAGLTFMIDGDSGDVANYRSMLNVASYVPGLRSTTTISDVQVGQYVSSAVTNVGVPGITYSPAGTNVCHVRVKASAANRVKIRCEIYKRSLAGTETELIMSAPSAYIPSSETPITHTFVSPGFTLLITDRIVRKYKVSAVDGPATTLELYYDGAEGNQTNSRLELPSSAVDMSQFVPYTGANAAVNIGAHNMTANAFYGDGSNLTGISAGGGGVLITTETFVLHSGGDVYIASGTFAANIGMTHPVMYSTITITGVRCYTLVTSTVAATTFNIARSTDTGATLTYSYLFDAAISVAENIKYSAWSVPNQNSTYNPPYALALHTVSTPTSGALQQEYGCEIKYWRRLD